MLFVVIFINIINDAIGGDATTQGIQN